MRKINFRGKRLDNGEWVYGHYADYIHPDCGCQRPSIIYTLLDIGNMIVAVDPSTISQFANVTDCNDKEIYEGDILRNEVYDWNNEKLGYGYYEVYWEDAENGFHISPINETAEVEEIRKWHWLNDMEIVGNRFDNPELLKIE